MASGGCAQPPWPSKVSPEQGSGDVWRNGLQGLESFFTEGCAPLPQASEQL